MLNPRGLLPTKVLARVKKGTMMAIVPTDQNNFPTKITVWCRFPDSVHTVLNCLSPYVIMLKVGYSFLPDMSQKVKTEKAKPHVRLQYMRFSNLVPAKSLIFISLTCTETWTGIYMCTNKYTSTRVFSRQHILIGSGIEIMNI